LSSWWPRWRKRWISFAKEARAHRRRGI
jgi:hypothetical protein